MDEQVIYLIKQGEGWVREQRDLHRPDALALKPQASTAFEPFFGAEVIQDVRFKAVPVIENPGFYREMEATGQPIPIDFSDMHGITFGDTVLLSRRHIEADDPPMSLLFHEMVHVVQYGLLGVGEFISRYVTGWAENGFEYMAIPLERDAYELEYRFKLSPQVPFSVREEVSKRLGLTA